MRFFDRGLQVRTNIGGQFSPLALKITCAGERAMECCDLSIIWACPALAPVHAGRARFRQGFSGRARRSFSEGGSGYPLYSSLRCGVPLLSVTQGFALIEVVPGS